MSSTSLTSADALNTAVTFDAAGFLIAHFGVSVSGTVTAGTLNFEYSINGGANWFALTSFRCESGIPGETLYALSTTGKGLWAVALPTPTTLIRLRLNPVITGSGTVTVTIGAGPTDPVATVATAVPTQNTHLPAIGMLSEAIINFASSGDNTIVAGVAGQTVRVFRMFFVTNTATNVTPKDGSVGLTGAISMGTRGSFVLDLDGEPWFTTSTGNAFVINSSSAVQVSGRLFFTQG